MKRLFSSPRCELREIEPTDLGRVCQIVAAIHEALGWEGRVEDVAREIVFGEDLPPGGDPSRATHAMILDAESKDAVGVLCGYDGYPTEGCLYIGELLLHPAYHRRGLGRELLQCLERHALWWGFEELRLAVALDNWVALQFWVAMGYGEIVRLSESRRRLLELRKDLSRRRGLLESYDAVASSYGQTYADELSRKPFDRQLLAQWSEELPEGLVCDMGCGPGQIAGFLRAQGVEVMGMDISQGMLEVARGLHQGIEFRQGDLCAIPLPDASLAGLTCFYALIHVERRDIPRALAELYRVLQPSGRLLLAVHSGEGELHTQEWFEQEVEVFATLFQTEELRALVELAGFSVVSCQSRARYAFEYPTERIYLQAVKPGP